MTEYYNYKLKTVHNEYDDIAKINILIITAAEPEKVAIQKMMHPLPRENEIIRCSTSNSLITAFCLA